MIYCHIRGYYQPIYGEIIAATSTETIDCFQSVTREICRVIRFPTSFIPEGFSGE